MGERGEGGMEESERVSVKRTNPVLEGQRDWTGLTSIEINRVGERKFRAWIFERTTRGSIPLYYEEARDGGAEIAGVNPKTTPGWINKLVSPQGDFLLTYPVVEGKVKREITFKHSLTNPANRSYYTKKYKG